MTKATGRPTIWQNYKQGGCFCITCDKVITPHEFDMETFKSPNQVMHCRDCGRAVRNHAKRCKYNREYLDSKVKRL